MSESAAVEKAASSVPALASTPALEIGADDVALPRIYLGQYMSEHVQDGRVKPGCVFTALGSDDPDPQTLWEPDNKPGVRVHILAMRKGKSVSSGGELVLFAYDDPDAPPDAWVTYNYVVALPDVDTVIPFKWLLTRTGTTTAKNINLILTKNAGRGPAYVNAFDLTTRPRENAKGKFFVPQVSVAEADPDQTKVAESLALMVSGDAAEIKATGDEPAI